MRRTKLDKVIDGIDYRIKTLNDALTIKNLSSFYRTDVEARVDELTTLRKFVKDLSLVKRRKKKL